MSERRTPMVVFLCFFLSGLAGLAYEVIWIRKLSLIFGTTSFALSTVLASFMGGLALGSYLLGCIADRRRDHLRLYALLEIGIGVYGLLIPVLLKLVTLIYVFTSRSMGGSFYAMSLVRFLLCALVLIIPTAFMGGTLPLLSRYVVRRIDHLGSGVGKLYGINTLGAVCGTFITGYLLIGWIGVWMTTVVAAVMNGLVALLAYQLHRSGRELAPPPAETESAPPSASKSRLPLMSAAVLLGIGLSGFASLTYEVAWTRLLSLVLGSSVYAVTAMLTTFLLGIAIGSMIVSRFSDKIREPLQVFVAVEALVAISVLAVTPLMDRLPSLFLLLFARLGLSFWSFQLIQFSVCVLVMLLPTLFIGATLPLAAKSFTHRVEEIGRGVGTVYASNTVGSILGSFLAGFALIPLVGTQRTIFVAAAVNLVVAGAILLLLPQPRRSRRLGYAAGLLAVFLALTGLGGKWDRYMLNTGLFDSPSFSLHRVQEEGFRDFVYSYDIRYYEEGPYANVAVSQEAGNLFLQINGRTEASTTSDMSNQILVAQIPMLVHPNPEEVLVIGLGSGITLGSVLTHPVETAECVEISPAVVRAAAYFDKWHGDVTKNPRAFIIMDDGRNYLLATEKKYDVIVSEPSKPWISGVSNLFTRESYELYRDRLKPGGVACQWFHYYSMSPVDFKTTVRTFLSVFPYVQIWNAENNIFMVGSEQPLVINIENMEEKLAVESVRSDLDRIRVPNSYVLLGHYLFSEKEAHEYVGDGPLNTDDLPIIEFSAPRHRNTYFHEEILGAMLNLYPRFDAYPLVGHIRDEGGSIDYRLARLSFTSPISWKTGVAKMQRSVLPSDRLDDVEGPLVAYRLEANLLGEDGEEVGLFAISRAEFSEEKLKRTLELLAPGMTGSGEYTVQDQPAFWATYDVEGRPMAAATWFYPPNRLHYLAQLIGAPDATRSDLGRLVTEGARCEPYRRDE